MRSVSFTNSGASGIVDAYTLDADSAITSAYSKNPFFVSSDPNMTQVLFGTPTTKVIEEKLLFGTDGTNTQLDNLQFILSAGTVIYVGISAASRVLLYMVEPVS